MILEPPPQRLQIAIRQLSRRPSGASVVTVRCVILRGTHPATKIVATGDTADVARLYARRLEEMRAVKQLHLIPDIKNDPGMGVYVIDADTLKVVKEIFENEYRATAPAAAAPGSAGVFALAAIPARYALERGHWAEALRDSLHSEHGRRSGFSMRQRRTVSRSGERTGAAGR